MQFAIHVDNLDRLHKKMDRIRTKCEKYGCDFVYSEVGEEFHTKKGEDGSEVTDRFIIVDVEGTAKVNGWRFAATIDHTPEGNVIRKMIEDVEIPDRYYTAGPECEHCHSRRHRKDTYLVYNDDTHEFKQVGSSCLCDFTNGFSAEAAASYISLFDSLIEFESLPQGYSCSHWYEVRTILRYAVDFVNNLGYSSSTYPDGEFNPDSTKQYVIAALSVKDGSYTRFQKERIDDYTFKYGRHFNDESVINRVEEIIDYFKECDESSDYIHNLKVIANSEYVEARNIGYTASMVVTYNRHLDQVEENKRRQSAHSAEVASSQYIGEVKDRVEVNISKVDVITYWENQYGITVRYKLTDDKGNILMWDSSTGIDTDREIESIKGTIKKLDTFNDVKQTWLTRCKVKYADPEKETQFVKGTDFSAVISDFI